MFDTNDFVKMMKKAAVEAVDASKPANMMFGTVVSESPLQIMVDQKLTLSKKQLVLARDVTDYEVEMEPIPVHYTEYTSGGAGDAEYASHRHEYKGKKKFKVYNALKSGEEVILMQLAGGQKYIVIDRIEKG